MWMLSSAAVYIQSANLKDILTLARLQCPPRFRPSEKLAEVSRNLLNRRSAVTGVPVKIGFTARREDDLGIVKCFAAVQLNQAVDDRVLPYRMPGTGALPRIHRVGISPRAT